MNPHKVQDPQFKISLEEWRKYRGKWVALSSDGGRIVAASETMSDLENRLAAAGENPENVLFDLIEDEDIFLGGGEFS